MMKLTAEIMEKINAIVEENDMEYSYYAIRVQEAPFELGAMDHVSHVWIDGDDTGEELNGICGTSVDSLTGYHRNCGEYFGEHMAVIGGYKREYGEDFGEVIISDPVVVGVIS